MKKLLILTIVIVSFSACKTSKIGKYKPLTSFKGDTIKFVQKSILDRKTYYIGKELNVFLRDLNIPIVNHHDNVIHSNKFISPSIQLQIYSNEEQTRRRKNKIDPIDIEVTWIKPMLTVKCDSVIKNNNYARWSANMEEFYGKQIIGDLNLLKYDYSKLKDEKLITDKKKLAKYQPLNKFKGDTLSFINKSIIGRNEFYEGKKMSVLLKDLQIPVKGLWKGFTTSNVNLKQQGTSLQIFTRFENRFNIEQSQAITIVFKENLKHQTDGTIQKDLEFYSEKIIKSVYLSPLMENNLPTEGVNMQ